MRSIGTHAKTDTCRLASCVRVCVCFRQSLPRRRRRAATTTTTAAAAATTTTSTMTSALSARPKPFEDVNARAGNKKERWDQFSGIFGVDVERDRSFFGGCNKTFFSFVRSLSLIPNCTTRGQNHALSIHILSSPLLNTLAQEQTFYSDERIIRNHSNVAGRYR